MITTIGSVPFWDSYYGESSPQTWTTDGTYLYDNAGVAVAPIDSASATAATSGDNSTMSLLASLASDIPSIIAGWSAIQLTNVNAQRAAKGLPAINMAAYGPQVAVGLSQSTTSMILMIAAGLGLVLMLRR